jgi:hypothetical protein
MTYFSTPRKCKNDNRSLANSPEHIPVGVWFVLPTGEGLIFCLGGGQGGLVSLPRVDDDGIWKNEQLLKNTIYGLLMALLAHRITGPVREQSLT